MNGTLKLYLISLSMMSAFAIHPWIPLPMAIGIIGIIIFFINAVKNHKGIIFLKEDNILVVFMILILISLAVNDISQTNLNHSLAFLFVIIVYYLCIRNIFYHSKYSIEQIYKFIYIGVLLSAVYALFEFLTINYFTQFSFINDYIFRPAVQEYTPIYNQAFIRARSFTEESGVFALYLNAFAPFALNHIFKVYTASKRFLIVAIIILAYIVTFSAGGIGFLLISLIITLFFWLTDSSKKIRFSPKKLFNSVVILLFLSLVVFINITQILSFLKPLFLKLTLDNDSGRFERWQNALNLFDHVSFLQYFIGVGPGQVSETFNTGTTSFYIDRIVETGILGLSLFLLFIFFVFIRVIKMKTQRKYLYFCSLVSITLHFIIISNYWFPYLWTIIILIQLEDFKNNKTNIMLNKKFSKKGV